MNTLKAGADAAKANHLHLTGGCKGVPPLRVLASFVNKLNIQLVNDPTIPLLGKGRYLFFMQKSYTNICS